MDVLEEDGEFRIRDGEAPEAPVVDYRAPTVGGARWRAGSLWLDGDADIFLKEAVGAIAVWKGDRWQLDKGRLAGLRQRGDRWFRRSMEVLQRALVPFPRELATSLRAHKGEYGPVALAAATAVVLPSPALARQLLETSRGFARRPCSGQGRLS